MQTGRANAIAQFFLVVAVVVRCDMAFPSFHILIDCGGGSRATFGDDDFNVAAADEKGDRVKKPIDFIIADVASKLKALKAKLEIDASEFWFYTRILGGKWTAKNTKGCRWWYIGIP